MFSGTTEEYQEYLAKAREAAEKLAQALNEMQEFSQVAAVNGQLVTAGGTIVFRRGAWEIRQGR